MQWSTFVTAVLEHLSVDATRRGIENLRTRAIKNAVIDLQRYIIPYRAGQRTVYAETDLIPQGCAHMGALPAFAKPSRFYIGRVTAGGISGSTGGAGDFGPDFNPADFGTGGTSTPGTGGTPADFNPADFNPADFKTTGGSGGGVVTTPGDFGTDFNPADFKTTGTSSGGTVGGGVSMVARNVLSLHAWSDRQRLIDGRMPHHTYRYTISPQASRFLIFPQISAASYTRLLLVWDGIKESFADADTVPFPEAAAEAVAYYVKSKIQREVDKNINLSRENERDYVAKRLALYREAHESRDAEKDDEENATYSAPPESV